MPPSDSAFPGSANRFPVPWSCNRQLFLALKCDSHPSVTSSFPPCFVVPGPSLVGHVCLKRCTDLVAIHKYTGS